MIEKGPEPPMPMIPVQPGWVIVPAKPVNPNEWYHLVGWTEDMQPVVAWNTGIQVWRNVCGTDAYCVATLDEWNGNATPSGGADAVADVVRDHPGINSSDLRRILYKSYGIENQPAAIADAADKKLITINDGGPGKAKRHYPC